MSHTWTDEELMTAVLPPRRWAIKDLVPRGTVTLWVGALKEGKSWSALQAARAVVTGRPFMGHEVDPGNVYHLGLEDDAIRMQERQETLMAAEEPSDEPSRFHLLIETRGYPTVEEGGLGALEDFLEDTPDVRMVVVDILECFDPIRGGYHSAGRSIRRLDRLAHKHDVAIVAVMHTYDTINPNAKQWHRGIQGGIGSAAAAGSIVGLSHPGDDNPDAVLLATGKDVPNLRIKLKWSKERIFTLAEEGEAAEPASETTRKRQVILDTVSEHGWGKDPVSGASEPIPVGIDALDASRIIRRNPFEDWATHANVRQLMYQMRSAKPAQLIRDPDGEHKALYFTPMQAGVLMRPKEQDAQTSFGQAETPRGSELVA